jgi:hypothetical protein
MSQKKLSYCCSNPECHKMFTPDQATYTPGIMQQTEVGVGRALPHGTPLVHVLCPACNTIVTSIHVPADSI